MKMQNKVEIIVNKLEERRLRAMLDEAGLTAFTYIDPVKGQGDRGLQDGDGLSQAFTNIYFIIICSQEQFERIRERVRVFLRDVGGVCMVSQVEWLDVNE